jgi:hypothetical protein
MADTRVNPLTWNVPITNKDGTPTNEFMRKWLQQATVNDTITTLDTAAEISAALDNLGAAEGDMLVRGAAEWAALSPGAANYILTANGAGAIPSWQVNSGVHSGYNPGTPPTVVQFGGDTTGSGSVTLGTAPVNGNLLVAMSFNPTSDATGTGWTKQVDNTGGTDYGIIFTKVAGAGESTTQTPGAVLSGTGAIAMWELHGQAVAFFVGGASQNEATGQPNNTPVLLPNIKNCIGLSAVGVVPPQTILAALGAGTVDALLNTNNRYLAAGHGNLADTTMCGLLLTLSAAASSKGCSCLITA